MNTKLLDALVAEGLIQAGDHEGAVLFARRRQLHVEEALIQMGLLDEASLLKFQANLYKTYFVSTKKLASAPIHDSLLKLVTHKLAQKLCVFPVKFDPKAQELSIITVQPDDLDVLKAVQFATRVPKVRALVARPAAIQAAIRVYFENEPGAFSQIRNVAQTTGLTVDRDKRKTLTYEQEISPTPPPSRDANFTISPASNRDSTTGMPPMPPQRAPVPPPPKTKTLRRGPDVSAMPPAPGQSTPALPPLPQLVLTPSMLPMAPVQQPAQHNFQATPAFSGIPSAGPQVPPFDPAEEIASSVKKAPPGISFHDYLETLNVFVALLENERGELRNHSVQVARICRRLCDRLGLRQEESDTIVMAAYLHDVGKSSALHLTALNVAEYDTHRQQAKKSYLTPVRVFETVRLPPEIHTILTHLYERFDGQGFPDRLSGKEICLGARVIAMVETYADLVGHAGNPFRKKLSSQEAWDVLVKFKSKIFDPGLVDVFKLLVLGDDLRAKLLSDSRRALLIDSDAEETTVLELRLAEHGLDVTIARNSIDAENELGGKGGEFDLVISEVDLKPLNGFELLKKIRANGQEMPFVFHSKNAEGDSVQRGFELGADDFITKPASPDLVALKVMRVLDGAGRAKKKSGGVSGSLTEMALPDVVQILFHGRKSGKLTVTADGKRGEILFGDGMIFDASFGEHLREEAFYAMLRLRQGDFELDPNFRPTEQVIQVSPESLLLEGMRRFDEAAR